MSSGSTCAVIGCHNNSKKLEDLSKIYCVKHKRLLPDCPCPAPYALYSMPGKEERKAAWLAALRLKCSPKMVFVCSLHFVDNRPTELHPDPELCLGHHESPSKRPKLDCSVDFTSTVSDHTGISSSAHPPVDSAQYDHDYCTAAARKDEHDMTTQCDEIEDFMLHNNSDALRYTGIALEVFNILVSTLEGQVSNPFPMCVRDQVLMTLMKLKTNHVTGYLSKQFNLSESVATKIISYWIDKLEELLRPLVPWLPKKTIQATMPDEFKKNFPNTTCILHLSESLVQKHLNPDSYRESYSHYYNKVKYLVAVAPCGLIMFISGAYDKPCSYTFITKNSGILDHLMPGDEVMAEPGSDIKDLLFENEVNLVMPSFTAEDQATSARETAHVRIHVERAITRLKVYKILSQIVSSTMALQMNKILTICSALVNLREDVIRDSH